MIVTTLVVMLVVGPVGRAVPWLVLAFAFLPVLDVALSVLNHLVTTLPVTAPAAAPGSAQTRRAG